MKTSRRVLFAIMSLTAACKGEDKDDKPLPSAAPTTVAVVPTATAAVTADEPAGPKITPRVRAELDNRADGITGAPLPVAGAQAVLQTPTGWTTTKTDVALTASADKKSQLASASFAPAEGATGKLAATTAALGLTGCTWAPVEALTVGKSKLAASAADGLCTHGGAPVPAAWVAPTAEGLLVVGTWDAGGDANNVFGAMRSITKAGGGGDPTGIAACCQALHQNGKSAPPEQQSAYAIAAGLCDSLKNDPQGRAVLAQVRAALAGASAPATCK